MNSIAQKLNETIKASNPYIFEMLSDMGKALFMPKGILSQGAEAKIKAKKINATIGIAKEKGRVLNLPSVSKYICHLSPEDYLPYAPSLGINELRSEWGKQQYKKNPSLASKTIGSPIVTCGITHGVSLFSDMWVDKDDVIILPDMIWGNYNMVFNVRNSAKTVQYETFDDQLENFNIDSFEAVIREQAQNNKKLVVILNFPHNPTGYSVSTKEGDRITRILLDLAENGTNIVVACDDAYFGLFYDDESLKESLFAKLACAHERIVAVKLDGATKEDYVWGLRIGFITYGIYAKNNINAVLQVLESKTGGCIRGNISNTSHLSQSIVLASMKDPDYEMMKAQKIELLKNRAMKLKRVLMSPKYKDAFDIYPFNSGYFMCIRLKNINAESLRRHLLDKYETGLISIGENNIRVAFSCMDEADLETLFDIILSGINDFSMAADENQIKPYGSPDGK